MVAPLLTIDRLERRDVPPRALALSVGALLVPVLAAFTPGLPEDIGFLVWLLALVPPFLLAYYRGWRGVAVGMAGGMAVMTTVNALLLLSGRSYDDPALLLAIVATYSGIGIGLGIFSELLHRAREEAVARALQDGLTGLGNRRYADIFLDREFAAAQRGRAFSIVLFDLDRFKQLNDEHGHQAGDKALRAFAWALSRNTRTMNLSARYGGDEFVSILSGVDAAGAAVFVARVKRDLAASPTPTGVVSVSAGIAEYRPTMDSVGELYQAADQALYQSKVVGRGEVRVYGAR